MFCATTIKTSTDPNKEAFIFDIPTALTIEKLHTSVLTPLMFDYYIV
jgi:hypothetical protein